MLATKIEAAVSVTRHSLPPFGALALLDIRFCITAACNFELSIFLNPCDKWIPVTMAWRVIRLRMEDRPPIWKVAANILNKQSRTDKGGHPAWGLGEVLTTPPC
jgi:hypothetical protein